MEEDMRYRPENPTEYANKSVLSYQTALQTVNRYVYPNVAAQRCERPLKTLLPTKRIL